MCLHWVTAVCKVTVTSCFCPLGEAILRPFRMGSGRNGCLIMQVVLPFIRSQLAKWSQPSPWSRQQQRGGGPEREGERGPERLQQAVNKFSWCYLGTGILNERITKATSLTQTQTLSTWLEGSACLTLVCREAEKKTWKHKVRLGKNFGRREKFVSPHCHTCTDKWF